MDVDFILAQVSDLPVVTLMPATSWLRSCDQAPAVEQRIWEATSKACGLLQALHLAPVYLGVDSKGKEHARNLGHLSRNLHTGNLLCLSILCVLG